MLDTPDSATAERLATLVGANVRKQRKRRGWSMKELGRYCGTTAQTIHRLEAANMTLSVDWIERLSKAFAVRPHVLFGHLPEVEMERRERKIDDFRAEVRVFRERIDRFLELTEKGVDVAATEEKCADADQELDAAGPEACDPDAA